MSIPRKHHFVPESYLSRFTESGERTGDLWVFDRELKMIRKSDPGNSGYQRDFYRLDDGVAEDPFYFEKAFSELESGASQAINQILATKALPDKTGMEYLMSFVGLLAVRTPAFRKRFEAFRTRIAKISMDMACANAAQWEYHKKNS
jgi:hypothetical protein